MSANSYRYVLEKTKKAGILLGIVFLIFCIYARELYVMQIVKGQAFLDQAEKNSKRTNRITAQRGEIYDRNAIVPMVLNIDSFAVDMIPGEIPTDRFSTVLTRLSSILSLPRSTIEKIVPSKVRRSFQQFEVKTNVDYETIVNLAESIDELPGVSWRNKPIRSYIETGSMSHILGYVGDITRDDLQIFYNKGYSSNSVIGKTGIEKQYEELLRGKDGYESRFVDVKGRFMTDKNTFINPPEMGKNLVLTIDNETQVLVEKALGERMGSAIVLKPASGEILAMVSYPYYDPNLFHQTGGSSIYQEMLTDPNNPFLNRAVNASYPPASTFKVVMTAALLEEEAIDPAKKINCEGEITYGDRLFRCHIRKPGHGYLDLKHALAESCDVYYWITGRDNLGVDNITNYAQEFGFSAITNIDLPSEVSGFIPSPQWKERKFHEKWLGGDTMNMSIGQGFTLATPLQVANMVAMVVNSGTIYVPHLLKEVRDPVSNAVIKTIQPEVLTTNRISAETYQKVREYMAYTVSDGSAQFPLRNKIVKFAGKSGTAEVGLANRWHSWFVAFGPYGATPEETIVTVVMVEASNPWEWWAPYATNIIMQGYFGKQTYEESIDSLGFKYLNKHQRGRAE